jgi:hypothetical protein
VRDKLSIYEKIANFLRPPYLNVFSLGKYNPNKAIEKGEKAEKG